MFFVAIGYWTSSKTIFLRLLVLVAANALVNALIKDIFQDPRPPLELRLDGMVGNSYGLPSGHAQLAVVLWIGLALEVRKVWAWMVFTLIALGVMFSRLYLGVHDLEDVLAGAALGSVSLLVSQAPSVQNWVQSHSITRQSLGVAGISGIALAAWPGVAPDYIPMLAAWLIAALWSLEADERYVGFAPPTLWWKKVLAALIGAACLYLEQKALKLAGAAWAITPMLWALVAGITSGVLVSLVVPWLLSKARLASMCPPPDRGQEH
ncbi:phosphatase PAP2 family protein [Rhodoferax aquaticus]|nr:phosphatase PAP2 family protein [Rhodoferax aquaticus]